MLSELQNQSINFLIQVIFSFQNDSKMRGLNYIFSTLFLINSTLAQCPWQRDVPDLQTSCLCAYNLGNELSVQCDQVSDKIFIEIEIFISYGGNDTIKISFEKNRLTLLY